MALKETVAVMRKELMDLCRDLEKANEGNKAASQRVRTGTIKLAKTAKIYRKESLLALRNVKPAVAKKRSIKKAIPRSVEK